MLIKFMSALLKNWSNDKSMFRCHCVTTHSTQSTLYIHLGFIFYSTRSNTDTGKHLLDIIVIFHAIEINK